MTDLLSSKAQLITLFHCLRQNGEQPALDDYSLEEWKGLVVQAQIHRLAPLFYQRLVKDRKKEGLPEEVVQFLRESYFRCLGQNLVHFNELHKVLLEFQKNEIPTILLKGSHLAKFIYQNIGIRPMLDLDLMVESDHLRPALEILRKMGYVGSYLPLSAEELDVFHHAPRLGKPGQVSLELHWTLTDEDRGLQIEEQDLWQRVRPVQIDDVEALVLAPEDLILHICVHAAYGHLFSQQARSVVDLAEILIKEGGRINWEFIIDKTNRWQAQRGVFLMLFLAQQYMNSPVPMDVLTAMQPTDFDPLIIEYIFYMFNEKEPHSLRAGQLVNGTFSSKVYALLLEVFPERIELGRMYHIEARSWKLVLYYPVHWRDKVIRQWRNVINLLTGRGETGLSLKAIYDIQTWLQIPGFKKSK